MFVMQSKIKPRKAEEITEKRLIFSGHESFQCRNLWLKKGYDFIKNGYSFNDEDAVVKLGVGKNMVSSIRHWMKSFNIIDSNDRLTSFADLILDDEGFDPYLEDDATLWLLHYQLVKNNYASVYSIVFNELRREKLEFNKTHLVTYLKKKAEKQKNFTLNQKTLQDDFSVMLKMYQRSTFTGKDVEESFAGLLTELNLVKIETREGEEFVVIENNERPEIPEAVLLYAILDNENYNQSIGLANLEQDFNGVGSIFALSRTGIQSKIENMAAQNKNLIFRDHAGVKELQFKTKPTTKAVLKDYYAN